MTFKSVLQSVLFSQPYQKSASWNNKPSKFDFPNSLNRNIHELIYKMDDNLICMQIKEINSATDF